MLNVLLPLFFLLDGREGVGRQGKGASPKARVGPLVVVALWAALAINIHINC